MADQNDLSGVTLDMSKSQPLAPSASEFSGVKLDMSKSQSISGAVMPPPYSGKRTAEMRALPKASGAPSAMPVGYTGTVGGETPKAITQLSPTEKSIQEKVTKPYVEPALEIPGKTLSTRPL